MAKLTLKMNTHETIVITCGDDKEVRIDCHPNQKSTQGKKIIIDAPKEFKVDRVPTVTRLIEGNH